MCKYCERNPNIKLGWEQPPLEKVSENVSKELNLKVVIHDYKTTEPEMIITSDRFFPDLIGMNGIATTYIKIRYCPICGRKLGN